MLVRQVRAEAHVGESSGDLRTDVLEFLRKLAGFYAGPFGEAVRGVLMERDERAVSLASPDVPAEVAALVDAAVARGELSSRPPALVQNVGHALMTAELIHAGAPLSTTAIGSPVDDMWLPALLHGRSSG